MSRTNYQRGADKERRIIKWFKEQDEDNITIRSAGSHSPIDVIVINPRTRVIRLIQAKLRGKKNLSKKERIRIKEEGNKLIGTYVADFSLWE